MNDERTPRTEAGQRLLHDWQRGNVLNRLSEDGGLVEEQIARIETEARTAPLDAERLAQVIREVDGNHELGAGALAEAIVARLSGQGGGAQ